MDDRTSFSTGQPFSGRIPGLGRRVELCNTAGPLSISNQPFALRNRFDTELVSPTATKGESARIEKPGFQHRLMDSRPPSMIWKDTMAMEF